MLLQLYYRYYVILALCIPLCGRKKEEGVRVPADSGLGI